MAEWRQQQQLTQGRWLKWILPARCLLCDAAGINDLDLCSACLSELPRITSACQQCGLPLPVHTGPARCGQCIKRPPPFDNTIAPLNYAPPVDGLVNRFKHNRNLSAGRALAGVLASEIRLRETELPEMLIPVPLHRWRYWQRGLNQAQLLARDLSAMLDIPVGNHLKRHRATPHQQGLSAPARRANLKGAFRLRKKADPPARIALIDDVMTTGATVGECARVLKQAGVETVEVWCVARTLAPR